MTKPSPHQKRVVAALLALEQRHAWRWWPRAAIGQVVQARGFHRVIQISTMHALRDRGLVCTLRSELPAEVRRWVRCGCCCGEWGLTASGRNMAQAFRVHWAADTKQRIEQCAVYAIDWCDDDEGDRRKRWRDDDDDDDDDNGDFPINPRPRGPMAMV